MGWGKKIPSYIPENTVILQMIPTDRKRNTLYVLPVIGIMINSLSIIHVYRNGQPARKNCYIHTIHMLQTGLLPYQCCQILYQKGCFKKLPSHLTNKIKYDTIGFSQNGKPCIDRSALLALFISLNITNACPLILSVFRATISRIWPN